MDRWSMVDQPWLRPRKGRFMMRTAFLVLALALAWELGDGSGGLDRFWEGSLPAAEASSRKAGGHADPNGAAISSTEPSGGTSDLIGMHDPNG
jgi:hypothetical protein